MSLVRSARIRLFSNTATWFVYTAMILAQLAGLSMAEAYLNAGADWLSSSVSQRVSSINRKGADTKAVLPVSLS